jgi:hypothetical protein
MQILCLFVGILLFGSGLAMLNAAGRAAARRVRDLRTPAVKVAQASGHGRVEIAGRITEGEQGFVTAPLSGRQGVWVAIRVWQRRSSSLVPTLLNAIESKTFLLNDDSGAMALIEPKGAELSVRECAETEFTDQEQLAAFLRSRGVEFGQGELGASEQVLCAGSRCVVCGPSRRERASHEAPGRLVLSKGGSASAKDSLLISDQSQREQTPSFAAGIVFVFVAAAVMMAFGAAAAYVAVVGQQVSL